MMLKSLTTSQHRKFLFFKSLTPAQIKRKEHFWVLNTNQIPYLVAGSHSDLTLRAVQPPEAQRENRNEKELQINEIQGHGLFCHCISSAKITNYLENKRGSAQGGWVTWAGTVPPSQEINSSKNHPKSSKKQWKHLRMFPPQSLFLQDKLTLFSHSQVLQGNDSSRK